MTQDRPDETIEALRRAVAAVPGDAALRMHLAQILISAHREPEAVTELAGILAVDPQHGPARALMMNALGAGPAPGAAAPDHPRPPAPGGLGEPLPRSHSGTVADRTDPPTDQLGIMPGPENRRADFDWTAAETQLGDIAAPMFMSSEGDTPGAEPVEAFEVERPTVRLADVGGMQDVKNRLYASFLAPLQNPELRRLYGKSLRGGLLLYGPPGCGKTFLAKALAGELGASFISAGLSEILDMWIGTSEKNLHELFSQARRTAPCVLFLDEIDALAQKRTQTRNSATRGVVNQLLSELDGVANTNEGVYVLAATNQPWDIDPAMRRPGRLDRTVLVLPPDPPAREAIFRYHLSTRPIEGVDLTLLAARSEGLSGADIAYVCELATENALLDGVRTGHARLMGMRDLEIGLGQVRPSTGQWLDTVKTVVQYGEDDGTFAELKTYLKKVRRW